MNFGEVPSVSVAELRGWINNQPYAPRNLIAVVVRNLPGNTEDDERARSTLQALLELHALSITGLSTGFKAHTKTQIKPVIVFAEKYGRPIDQFFWWWFKRYGDLWGRQNVRKGSVDVMFFEPDPTHTVIQQAFFCYDMYPSDYPGLESKRDIARPLPVLVPKSDFPVRQKSLWQRCLDAICNRKTPRGYMIDAQAQAAADEAYRKATQLPVTFNCTTVIGPKVNEYAQKLLDGLNIEYSNPYQRDQSDLKEKAAQQFDPEFFRELTKTDDPDIYLIA
jgi:hypothetical protein